MLSSMEEGVLAVDRGGTMLSINETGAALLAAEAEQLRGRSVYEVIRKPDLLQFIETVAGQPRARSTSDLRFYGPEERWLNAHGTMLHDAQGHTIGVLVVLHDFTRLRHLENVRRDFVANVSHELRTPITSIKGFVETLLDEEPGGQAQRPALPGHRPEAGQSPGRDHQGPAPAVADRAGGGGPDDRDRAGAAGRRAGRRRRNVRAEGRPPRRSPSRVHCPDDLVARLNGPLVEQAVMNLVDNAIKYSEAESHDPGRGPAASRAASSSA